MDVRVKSGDLVRELGLAGRVVSRKPSLPILANVLLEAELMGDLRLAATDLDVGLRTACAAQVAEPGRMTVPALKLYELAKSLPDAEIRLKTGKTGVEVSGGRFDGRLQAMPAEEYPALPDPAGLPTLPIARPVLRMLLARVRFAVSDSSAQSFLQGALMVLPADGLTLVATDGHRLSLASGPRTGAAEPSVTLPTRALDALPEVLGEAEGDATFARSEQHLFFAADHRLLFSRMLSGTFPAYERIIPRANGLKVTVQRGILSDALKRAQLLLAGNDRSVLLQVAAGAMDLKVTSAEVGDGQERVPVEFDGAALPDLRFNAQYILDFLGATDGEAVVMEIADAMKPSAWHPAGPAGADMTYVLMPMAV